jgi:signal transduction histidine kinase
VTIRKLTILAITISFSIMIVIMLVISRFVLLNNFNNIEANNVQLNTARVQSALSYTLSDMGSTTTDWASWDDTYTFIEDGNSKYINSNLTDSTFIELRLNLILFINSSGKTVFRKAFDLNSKEEIKVPPELQTHLSNGSLPLNFPDPESGIEGLLLLPEGSPLLITARSILASDGKGPARGMLIFGRYLNATEVDRLSQSMSLSLAFYRADETSLPLDVSEIYPSLLEKITVVTKLLDSQHIAGYALVNDIYGRPGLIVKVDMPRDIYREGQNAVTYIMLTIVTVGVVFGLVALQAAEKHELSRLKKLAQAVKSIGTSGNFSERVLTSGKDEISSLANNINSMLASLQQAQEELKANTEHLKIAVVEAQSANLAKSEFLSSVSHELRTPLTAIIGLTQLLQKKYYGPLNEKQADYIQDILGSSNHLLSLINNILDMAKIEAGKSRLELAETQVKELIGGSLLFVKENAAEKRIDLRLEIPEEILNLRITADKLRFRQVMVNLLSNAIKFTETKGKVVIEAEKKEDELMVSVSDNGIGISLEEQGKIFDAFYQVNTKITSKIPGTGLGLCLAKHLVELHQGRIWVESEGIGKGSSFSFTISLSLQSQEPEYEFMKTD